MTSSEHRTAHALETPPEGAPSTQTTSSTDSLRLLQISDMHLVADPAGALLGQKTRQTFEAVLDLSRSAFPAPDLVLLTGDLVHDASVAAYAYLATTFATFRVPFFCLPGNHDSVSLLVDLLDPTARQRTRCVDCATWRLILLDSTVPDSEGGHLHQAQLEELDQALTEDQRPTLITLHHHPVPVESAWLDRIGLDNGTELMSIVHRHPQVRCVLWGHIHQDFTNTQSDCRLLGSPSTCIQFQPRSSSFALDPTPPGFRWLILHRDGDIESGIERLAGYPQPLDANASGY